MLHEQDLNGVLIPVVTPFLADEQLDLESFGNLLSSLLDHEITGLVVNGTTGESPTLSWEEVSRLTLAAQEAVKRKKRSMPIIVGTGTNHTASTIKRTEQAGELGADAVLVVVPYYNRPSQEGILEHFHRVSQVGLPVIVYEIPARTGVRLTTDTARRIMDLNGVIGMKDCSGGIGLVSELTHPGSKPILCGEDSSFHDMLCQGASGGMLASANVHTGAFIQMYDRFRSGDRAASQEAFDRLAPLIRRLFQEPNPAPLKWMLARQGVFASDTLRLPMSPITLDLQRELEPYLTTIP